MELLKLLTANEIVTQVVSFLILLFALRAILWRPVLHALDARREKIVSDLDRAATSRATAEALQTDYEKKLQKIDDLSRARIQEAIVEGQREAAVIKKKAYEDSQQIMDAAYESIRRNIGQIKRELRDQVVDLTIKATEEILQEKLTEAQDRRIVEDFLKKMDNVL